MRGLTVILVDADRLEPALTLVMAQAALGGRARLFAQGRAVAALGEDSALLAEALELGAEVLACQTGLAETGLALDTLDPRITAAGPVSVLRTLGEDRLLLA